MRVMLIHFVLVQREMEFSTSPISSCRVVIGGSAPNPPGFSEA